MSNSKDKIERFFLNMKYKNKIKKFNISEQLFEHLLDIRNSKYNNSDILKVIDISKTPNDFKINLLKELDKKEYEILDEELLFGTIIGKYDISYGESFNINTTINSEHFSNVNKQLLNKLKENFYEFLISDNHYKNSFKSKKGSIDDYTKDFTKEEAENTFDDFLNGNSENFSGVVKKIIEHYISYIINEYDSNVIMNDFDFILRDRYDILDADKLPYQQRWELYQKTKNLSESQNQKIKGINILKAKLNKMNSLEARKLLDRLIMIENDGINKISKLEDIYLDYEVLYRKELIDSLYVPTEKTTIVEDFRDVRPQLIHMFFNSQNPKISNATQEIHDKIIAARTNGDKSDKLSQEEQKQLEDYQQAFDDQFNPTKVNYYYNYDKSLKGIGGVQQYYSNVNNQISTSLYSKDYLILKLSSGTVGLCFNSEGVVPEGIIISSTSFLKTNTGINNIETLGNQEYLIESSNVEELKSYPLVTEIVLFRNNIDFDTKASYLFASIDSRNQEETNNILNKCKEILKSNSDLKLVIYDIYKIQKSFNQYLEEQKNIENQNNTIDETPSKKM